MGGKKDKRDDGKKEQFSMIKSRPGDSESDLEEPGSAPKIAVDKGIRGQPTYRRVNP